MNNTKLKSVLILLCLTLTFVGLNAQETQINLNIGKSFKCIENKPDTGIYIGGKLCFKSSVNDSNLLIYISPNIKYGIIAPAAIQDWVLVDFESKSFRSLFEFMSISNLGEYPIPHWISTPDSKQDEWVFFEKFNAKARLDAFQFIKLQNATHFEIALNSLLPDTMTYSFAEISNYSGDRAEVLMVCSHLNDDLKEALKWVFVNADLSARNATVRFEKRSFERPFDILKYTTPAHLLCRIAIENLAVLPGTLGSTWYFDQITNIESKNEKALEAVDENDRSAGRIEVDRPEWIVMADFVKHDAKGVITSEKKSIKFIMGMEMGFYWVINEAEIKTEALTK